MDKNDGWVRITPEQLAGFYSKGYKNISYTGMPDGALPKRVVIDNLLNELHEMASQYIEEALSKSDLSEAKQVIEYIKNK